MKSFKILCVVLAVLILTGCQSKPQVTETPSQSQQEVSIGLQDVLAYLQSPEFESKNENYIIEFNDIKHKARVSFAEQNGPTAYIDCPLSSYTFISNNSNYYFNSCGSHFLYDSEKEGFFRVRQEVVSYSHNESLTIFEEITETANKTEDLITFESEIPYFSDAYKTTYKNSEDFDPVKDYRKVTLYDIFAAENYADCTIKRSNDIITFRLITLPVDGEVSTYVGTLNLKTFDMSCVFTTFNEGVFDVERSYSIKHGDFAINYDTSKDYREEQAN